MLPPAYQHRHLPAIDRFWLKVDRSGDCWLWTAYISPQGYGQFRDKRRNHTAHRWIYDCLFGLIDPDLTVDHLCRTRACVRPSHLEAVTCGENLLRGDTVTARNAAKTHCVQGHLYDEVNTYYHEGNRHCRRCRLQRNREWYARKKATEGLSDLTSTLRRTRGAA